MTYILAERDNLNSNHQSRSESWLCRRIQNNELSITHKHTHTRSDNFPDILHLCYVMQNSRRFLRGRISSRLFGCIYLLRFVCIYAGLSVLNYLLTVCVRVCERLCQCACVCVCMYVRVRVCNASRMLNNAALPNISYVIASFSSSLFLWTAFSSPPQIFIGLFFFFSFLPLLSHSFPLWYITPPPPPSPPVVSTFLTSSSHSLFCPASSSIVPPLLLLLLALLSCRHLFSAGSLTHMLYTPLFFTLSPSLFTSLCLSLHLSRVQSVLTACSSRIDFYPECNKSHWRKKRSNWVTTACHSVAVDLCVCVLFGLGLPMCSCTHTHRHT